MVDRLELPDGTLTVVFVVADRDPDAGPASGGLSAVTPGFVVEMGVLAAATPIAVARPTTPVIPTPVTILRARAAGWRFRRRRTGLAAPTTGDASGSSGR